MFRFIPFVISNFMRSLNGGVTVKIVVSKNNVPNLHRAVSPFILIILKNLNLPPFGREEINNSTVKEGQS